MSELTQIRRVLVLDDDEVMRDLLQALLEMQGYEVVLACSGAEALDLIRSAGRFDLVLTDLHMPELEGEQLARTLRSALNARTLLIGMSGSLALKAERDALDAFVPKPFDLTQLEQAMKTAQDRRAAVAHEEPASGPAATTSAQTASEPEVSVLNETIFASMGKLLPMQQLIELYSLTLKDVHKRHERIEASAAEGDLAAVKREAHAIKGACGMVGAAELQALADTIEGGTTLNTQAIAEIPSACIRLRRMLDAKLQIA